MTVYKIWLLDMLGFYAVRENCYDITRTVCSGVEGGPVCRDEASRSGIGSVTLNAMHIITHAVNLT